MVSDTNRSTICDKVFTIACGQHMTVTELKFLALKIVEKSFAKVISCSSKDFKVIKLLRLEDTEITETKPGKKKMQQVLNDKKIMWNSFSERRGSITVILTAESSTSKTS